MAKNKQENISNSIVLIGPSGVGKSLIATTLSQKTNMPLLDIDDLICFIQMDMFGSLSPNAKHQRQYIKEQIKDLKSLERETPLSPEETKREEQLVYEFVDLYNYYHKLVGGFDQFYSDYYDYTNSKAYTKHEQIYSTNKFAYQIINKVFNTTNTPLVISPPACFGWNSNNPFHHNLQFLQTKIGTFLESTQTVLLSPGEDFHLRTISDPSSINDKLLLKYQQNYYKNADLEISTNGLFNEPENDFLKQRSWLNVRETMTKENLKNTAEINNICDQIIEFSQANTQILEDSANQPQIVNTQNTASDDITQQ